MLILMRSVPWTSASQVAMNPERVAKNFGRLELIMDLQKVRYLARTFNLEDSGLFVCA